MLLRWLRSEPSCRPRHIPPSEPINPFSPLSKTRVTQGRIHRTPKGSCGLRGNDKKVQVSAAEKLGEIPGPKSSLDHLSRRREEERPFLAAAEGGGERIMPSDKCGDGPQRQGQWEKVAFVAAAAALSVGGRQTDRRRVVHGGIQSRAPATIDDGRRKNWREAAWERQTDVDGKSEWRAGTRATVFCLSDIARYLGNGTIAGY